MLADNDERVLRSAVEAAGDLQLQETRDIIVALLSGHYPATRAVAVRGLAKLWHDEMLPRVIEIFRRDPVDFVRKEAAWTLRSCVTESWSRELFDLWRADTLPRHRVWACEIATIYPSTKLASELARLCADTDGHVRNAARRALRARPGCG